MRKASRQCFSKPSAWVVSRRIKQRQLGYRESQVRKMILAELAELKPFPSLRKISAECDIDGTGNVCRILRNLIERGEVPDRAAS